MTKQASLYFHIPFCTRKCDYCHFYVIPDKKEHQEILLEGLRQEWQYRLPLLAGYTIETVYFGGGTPSLLGPAGIQELLNLVRNSCTFNSENPEITLEANPETLTVEKAKEYRLAGINRLSIGVQTLDDELLSKIGRQHNAAKALESIDHAYEGGITNISIDLMYDLPGQTLASWKNTLEQIKSSPISHLSLYNLTIEPHTVFYKHRAKLGKIQPSEADSLAMYLTAVAELDKLGLRQYEISAFSLPTKESNHNKGYWTGRPFLGYGPSAYSYWEGSRFRNIAHLHKWSRALKENQDPCDFKETLSEEASRNELLAIHLRLLEGVELNKFQRTYGKLSEETQQSLAKLCDTNLLKIKGEIISLTSQGITFYDTVATEIVSMPELDQ